MMQAMILIPLFSLFCMSSSPMLSWFIVLFTSLTLSFLMFKFSCSSFFPFVLVLVFVGGVMILFIFVSSLYHNSFKLYLKLTFISMLFFLYFLPSSAGSSFVKLSLIHYPIFFLYFFYITFTLSLFFYVISFKGITLRTFISTNN